MDSAVMRPAVMRPVDMRRGGTALRALLPALLLSLASLVLPARAAGQLADPQNDRYRAAAIGFIEHLSAGRFDSAAARVSPAVSAGALDADRLRMAWGQITTQVGPLEGLHPAGVGLLDTLRVIDLNGQFERTPMRLRVTLTPGERVVGFFILPAELAPLPPPPYADTTSYWEEPVTIGEGRFQLQGTFALPSGASRVPVVVLLHGSGPHDRDGRTGGNAPLRDIAWGLASRGIAVLRFDKRTLTHGAAMASGPVTLEEEVLEDATAAIAVARAHAATDPARVYLLGHSLGGMVAPEVALRDGRLAGVILLGAPARTLSESVLDQLRHLREHATSPEERRQLESLASQLPAMYDDRAAASDTTGTDTAFPALASWWRELDAFDQLSRARRMRAPILVLHGERDYQVTMRDFELWRSALADRPATFVSFPALNHRFVSGTGVSLPAEYERPDHVAAEVIEAIEGWIGKK